MPPVSLENENIPPPLDYRKGFICYVEYDPAKLKALSSDDVVKAVIKGGFTKLSLHKRANELAGELVEVMFIGDNGSNE
jgi:hypothetical protein